MYKLSLPSNLFRSRKCTLISFWISLNIMFLFLCLQYVRYHTEEKISKGFDVPFTTTVSKCTAETTYPTEILKEVIKSRNKKQAIQNLDIFGPITNHSIIIVIQAHRRKMYLEAVIESLKATRFINHTLLVISHGYYDGDINNLVESISFTRVLQIFFPYSVQTHPNSFPGFSPGDCPHGVPLQKNCTGKARDFKILQLKHHWWWKINFIFEHLRIAEYFKGLVFFLEEDHYVFPDVLYMLKAMQEEATDKCPDCNVFGLGRDPNTWRKEAWFYQKKTDKVGVQQWNGMGFAFTRQFWNGLDQPKCREMFCSYNDYNWDFTLAFLSHKCLPSEIKPLVVVAPRVIHIGDCGVHYNSDRCDETKSLNEAQDLLSQVDKYLFPPKLTVSNTDFRQFKVNGLNGGWDDIRDVQLCNNISKYTLD